MRRLSILLFLSLAALCLVPSARAQLFDTRGMAMGGVSLPTASGHVARVNPAYRAVRGHESFQRMAINLPIGLLQNIDSFPELDPEDEDFNLIEVIQYGLNIPWAWEFRRQVPPTSDVELWIAQDQLVIDLKEAQEYVPEDGFSMGGFGRFLDLGWTLDLGQRYGVLRFTGVQGYTWNEMDFTLDDEFRSVLSEATPIVGGKTYAMRGNGILEGGFRYGLVYAREIPLSAPATVPELVEGEDESWLEAYWDRENERPRLWLGLGVHRYVGLGYARLDGDVHLTGQEPLLGSDQSFDVDYDALYRTAHAEWFGDFGSGWGLDLGAVMRWRAYEMGIGVSDLAAELTWPNTRIDHYYYDEISGDLMSELVADGVESKTDIPTSWRWNALRRFDRAVIAGDVEGGPGGTSLHLGSEYWMVDWMALRGGIEQDTRGETQFGWGAAWRAGRVGWDVGFRTHSRNLNGVRGISMGLALVIY